MLFNNTMRGNDWKFRLGTIILKLFCREITTSHENITVATVISSIHRFTRVLIVHHAMQLVMILSLPNVQ